MASTATAASARENRTSCFGAVEASAEIQYPDECWDRGRGQVSATEARGHQLPMARRSSSFLALTLEEIQNTMCEAGKNFGSMNMDEFLSNIWTAEEGAAVASGKGGGSGDAKGIGGADRLREPVHRPSGNGGGPDAAASNAATSLNRQGSVSVLADVCRKTVDDVWSEIQRDQERHQQELDRGRTPQHQYQSTVSAPRQSTAGEMTLEDFLIKAGVVRDEGHACSSPPMQFPLSASPPPQKNQCVLPPSYQLANDLPGYAPITMPMDYGDPQTPGSTANGVYHNYHQQHGRVVTGYGGVGNSNVKGGEGGGCGRMSHDHVRTGSPTSPLSSDGFGGRSQVDDGNPGGQWGADVTAGSRVIDPGAATAGGRKRVFDGPADKAMERRQRRMIKNRESAARSRARKQAYTVELETEMNNLKEDNARLHEEHRRVLARWKHVVAEAMAERAQAACRKKGGGLGRLRHCRSCFW